MKCITHHYACDCREAKFKDLEALLKRCVIELCYVHSVENCHSGLCKSSEGKDCIASAEKLLGFIKDWPENK